MRRILALVMIALILPMRADAMMCLSKQSVRSAFETSSVVFSGRVLDVEQGTEDPTARVEVLQVWKGPVEVGQIVQTTAADSVTFVGDGFVPKPGTTLLVYATTEEPYFLFVCSRTRELDPSSREIRLLDRLVRRKR
jgi:hypothetical protein